MSSLLPQLQEHHVRLVGVGLEPLGMEEFVQVGRGSGGRGGGGVWGRWCWWMGEVVVVGVGGCDGVVVEVVGRVRGGLETPCRAASSPGSCTWTPPRPPMVG